MRMEKEKVVSKTETQFFIPHGVIDVSDRFRSLSFGDSSVLRVGVAFNLLQFKIVDWQINLT